HPDGNHVEHLRATRCKQTREQEGPDPAAPVGADGRGRAADDDRDETRDERTHLGVAVPPHGEPERDGKAAEEHRRAEREADGCHDSRLTSPVRRRGTSRRLPCGWPARSRYGWDD